MKEKFHVIVISASNTFHAQHLAHYCNVMLHYVAGLYINVHVYHCICGCTLLDTLQCCCDWYWNAAACLKRFFSAFGHVGHTDCPETLLPTALHMCCISAICTLYLQRQNSFALLLLDCAAVMLHGKGLECCCIPEARFRCLYWHLVWQC